MKQNKKYFSDSATRDGNHRDNVEQIVVENPGVNNLHNKGGWRL